MLLSFVNNIVMVLAWTITTKHASHRCFQLCSMVTTRNIAIEFSSLLLR